MRRLLSKTAVTQREWDDLARVDPLWAILSNDTAQFGRWDLDQFFASGQREIDTLMKSIGLAEGNHGRVLDFGCGVGRLSRALLSYFGEVHAVDISAEMIRLAKKYTPSCTFVVHSSDNLNLFPDNFFDFVYSNIVLQHQRTRGIAKSYIKEFIRVLKPSGTIVFQIPHKLSLRDAVQPRRRIYSVLRTLGISREFLYEQLHLNPMRTISLGPEEVKLTVSSAGGRLVRSYADNFNRLSMSYVVTKDQPSSAEPL